MPRFYGSLCICKPCIAEQRREIIRKVIRSFKQDVQCVGYEPLTCINEAFASSKHSSIKQTRTHTRRVKWRHHFI